MTGSEPVSQDFARAVNRLRQIREKIKRDDERNSKFRNWLYLTQIVVAIILIFCINVGITITLDHHPKVTQTTGIGATKSYPELIDEGVSDIGTNVRDTHFKINKTLMNILVWIITPILFIVFPSLASLFIFWGGIRQGVSQDEAVGYWLYIRSVAWFFYAGYVISLIIVGYLGGIITELDTSSDWVYHLYHLFLYSPVVIYLLLAFQVKPVNDFPAFVLLPCLDIGDASNLVSIMSHNSWKLARAESARTVEHQWLNYDIAIIVVSALYLLLIPTLTLIIQSRATLFIKKKSNGEGELNDNTCERIGRYPHLIICLVMNAVTLTIRILLMVSHSNADYSFIIKNGIVIVTVFLVCCPCCDRIDDLFTMEINGQVPVPVAALRGSLNAEDGYGSGAPSTGRQSAQSCLFIGNSEL